MPFPGFFAAPGFFTAFGLTIFISEIVKRRICIALLEENYERCIVNKLGHFTGWCK